MFAGTRRIISFVLALALCFSLVNFVGATEITDDPVYSATELSFSTGSDGVAIPTAAVSQMATLSGGTIIAEFTPTTTTIASSIISLSNSTTTNGYFHIYVDNRGFL